MHFVGAVAQRTQHTGGVCLIARLAKYLAVAVNNGVAAQNHILRMGCGYCLRLGHRQSPCQVGRAVGGNAALINRAWHNRVVPGDQSKQFPPPRAAGCEQ